MISFEAFEQMVADITETLPEEFFRELSGGVMVKEERKLHPQSVGAELNIMGEYRRHPHLGRFVVIYYGSFAAVYGYEGPEELKSRGPKDHPSRVQTPSGISGRGEGVWRWRMPSGWQTTEKEDRKSRNRRKKMLDESLTE